MVSEVKIWPVNKAGSKFKANGVATLAETVKVTFKIMEGTNGLFVSFPQEEYEKDGKKQYKKLVDFASREVSNDVQSRIIAAYNNQVNGAGEESQVPQSKPGNKVAKNIPF